MGAGAVFMMTRGDGVVRPDEPCASPVPLVTRRGVTLQPVAMQAFREAELLAGRPIEVIQSYRSCAKQAMACKSICGNPEGCPGLCAPPGLSYHQIGAAIDVSQAALDTPASSRRWRRRGGVSPSPGTTQGTSPSAAATRGGGPPEGALNPCSPGHVCVLMLSAKERRSKETRQCGPR